MYVFLLKISIQSNLYNTVSYLYINDFFINNYYFLWTQFFLLPTLLYLIHYTYNILSVKSKNFIVIFVLTVGLSSFLWWIFEYYALNNFQYILKTTPYFFNNLLYNPLNKYHPILFFSAYIYVYKLVNYQNIYKSFYNTFHTKFYYKILYKISTNQLNTYWFLLLISLYLGSWWALQEGSWGGWWNWDASEVFGLIILTFMLYNFHTYIPYVKFLKSSITNLYLSMFILHVYVILQLSYTLVSHNFGLSLLNYGYVSYNFIVIGLLTLSINYTTHILHHQTFTLNQVFYKNYLCTFKSTTDRKYGFTNYNTFLILWTFLIFYIYIISFNPIINNIFWTSLNIEVLNKWFSWLNIKLVTLLLLIILIWPLHTLLVSLYFMVYVTTSTHYIILLVYKISKTFYTNTIHILLFTTIILSIQYSHHIFISWNLINSTIITWYSTYFRPISNLTILFDNAYIVPNLINTNHTSISVSNSFYFFNTSLDNQFFSLDLNNSLLRQIIYNNVFMYTFNVTVYDFISFVSDSTTLILTVLISWGFYSKIKIIF